MAVAAQSVTDICRAAKVVERSLARVAAMATGVGLRELCTFKYVVEGEGQVQT